MNAVHSSAPQPAYRLIPSRFPPIGLFDTVASAADLAAVMELVGWTNDRLVAHRLARLPVEEWVFGRPNASVVMAAFLHGAPAGGRFNGTDIGAWYAAADIVTAAAEVGHHLRREAFDGALQRLSRVFRAYSCRLAGNYRDIRGALLPSPALHASDSHAAGQLFGEGLRATGAAGVLYDSVRRRGGVNVAAFRPRNILDVTQTEHFEITARLDAPSLRVRRLFA
ncbi:MAG: RES family NAD+ phosphorylase [Beijerinckiaceae bacterium]